MFSKIKANNYATFPRQFISYRWFKPLLVLGLSIVFYFAIALVIVFGIAVLSGDIESLLSFTSYDDIDPTNPALLAIIFLSVAVMMPALLFAGLIVQDRPFSSISSSRGGWNWKTFFKTLVLAFLIVIAFMTLELTLTQGWTDFSLDNFSLVSFIVITLFCPFQCVAEEYVFRGFLLQTFSSWFKFPIIGIVLSSILFTLGHGYDITGMISIFFTGVIWGYVACATKGLETSSAIHIANNILAFYTLSFGLGAVSSDTTIVSAVIAIGMDLTFAVVVVLIGKQLGWFESNVDGTVEFNKKKRAEYEYKAWANQLRNGRQIAYGAESGIITAHYTNAGVSQIPQMPQNHQNNAFDPFIDDDLTDITKI